VAVLPSGLDNIYPPAHAQVAERIRRQGTLLTEYPAGAISFKSNFIIRNRLVSGLSDVVLITEAALKSGSLHTARFALEQGKTVMAVPGNITSPSSEGCNNLIKSGAIPVTDVSDIFFALGIKPEKPRHAHAPRGDARLQAVYELIRDGLSAQEELAAVAKLDGPALAGTLTMLEISGYIRPTGSGNWVVA
ncbi:MAG TPA: DNA-processing protein DprA, partial [Candidatus Saccharimonadales bacterium]|nr:DNA-processing protein DprA [Candidatus Saccharimonadales bacterium]